MGFRHLNEARVTKKHLKWIGIFYLAYTIFGIVVIFTDSAEPGDLVYDETPFQSFLYWELGGIAFIALWTFVRYLNRLIYGGDIDL